MMVSGDVNPQCAAVTPHNQSFSNKFHKIDQMHLLPIPFVVRIRKGKLFSVVIFMSTKGI